METHDTTDESSDTMFKTRRGCFSFPCFDRTWRKQQTDTDTNTDTNGNSLWSRSVSALMKIREWSELVAGPRWKTFIRRFNRNRSSGHNNNKHVNFQYDPLSYAMNFDEGPGQSSSTGLMKEEENEYYYGSRNFSARYAKGSMDLDKDGIGPHGPTFV